MRDLTFYALPMKTFMMERVLSGAFPLWTPHISTGMPFFAELSHQVLYPFNLLFLLLGANDSSLQGAAYYGLSLFGAFHGLFAMVALWLLARTLGLSRFIAFWTASLYGFSGYVLSITDNVNYLPATVWIPLGLFALFRGIAVRSHRYTVLLGGCLALMYLAGDTFNPMVMCGTVGIVLVGQWVQGYLERKKTQPETTESPALICPTPYLLSHCLGGIALGLMLAAVQLLPAYELVQLSVRHQPLSFGEATLWSFPPERLVEFILPFFYGSKYPSPHFLGMFLYPQFREPWVDSVYLGLIPVFFALVGMSARQWNSCFWALVLVLSLGLSFGSFVDYYPMLFKFLPMLQFHRYPEKYILWTTLSLVMLAGIGAQLVFDQGWKPFLTWIYNELKKCGKLGEFIERHLEWNVFHKTWLSFLLLLGLTYYCLDLPAELWIWPHARENSTEWGPHFVDRLAHLNSLKTIWILLLGTILGFLWVPLKMAKVYLQGVLLLAVGQLVWTHWDHLPSAPAELLANRPEPVAMGVIRHEHPPQGYRVFYDDLVEIRQTPSVPLLKNRIAESYQVPVATVADPYPYHWIYKFLFNQERLLFNYGIVYHQSYLNGRFAPLQPLVHHQMDQLLLKYNPQLLMRLSGVRYIISPVEPLNPSWASSGYEEIYRDAALNLRILRVAEPLPKAYLASDAILNSDPMVYKILTPWMQHPENQVELAMENESQAAKKNPHPLSVGGAIIEPVVETVYSSPERYELNVTSSQDPAYLILNESFFPGWKAMVDDQVVQVYQANHRFMAIRMPQGNHRVRFEYHSTWLGWGELLSLLAILLVGVLLFKPHWLGRWAPWDLKNSQH